MPDAWWQADAAQKAQGKAHCQAVMPRHTQTSSSSLGEWGAAQLLLTMTMTVRGWEISEIHHLLDHTGSQT